MLGKQDQPLHQNPNQIIGLKMSCPKASRDLSRRLLVRGSTETSPLGRRGQNPRPQPTQVGSSSETQTPRGRRTEAAGDHLQRTTARRGGYSLSGPRWEQRPPALLLLLSLPRRRSRSPRQPFIHRPVRGRTPSRLLLENRCRASGFTLPPFRLLRQYACLALLARSGGGPLAFGDRRGRKWNSLALHRGGKRREESNEQSKAADAMS